MIYECGEKPIGQAWFNFNPRFYLIALVVRDLRGGDRVHVPGRVGLQVFIEKGQGLLAFAEIFRVRGDPRVGLAYVWAMGDLDG